MVQRSTDQESSTDSLIGALKRNWRVEMEGSATYRHLAARESDPRRKAILLAE